MSEALEPLSLSSLQRRLDELPPGGSLAIAISDYRRLFGLNDLAHARLANFAEGHGCTVDPRPSLIVFRREARRPG